MANLLTQFHYQLLHTPKFEIGKEKFDIKSIYDFYTLKVYIYIYIHIWNIIDI